MQIKAFLILKRIIIILAAYKYLNNLLVIKLSLTAYFVTS